MIDQTPGSLDQPQTHIEQVEANPDETPTPLHQDLTFGQAVVAGLLGVGVAFLCFVPPILHFITGPLAPGIGGFVAGPRTGASGDEIWIIGATIGLGLAVLLGIAAFVISAVVSGGRPLPGLSAAVSGGALVYGTLLGTLGASFGGRMGRAH